MKMRTKLFAFLAVALMMALPLAAFIPSADADSDSNNSIDRIDDIADLQPIDLPEGFGDGLEGDDAMLLGDSRATGVLEGMYPGSWTWDKTTGIGPYNSFYGAFDIDDGNRFVGVLDPYNLKQLVDGTPLSTAGHYNIMWVLPTVYWSVDANGNLELSSDPTKGTAYAHTVDGHTYKYVAYGVYEGTSDDNDNPTILTSESGKPVILYKSRTTYRTLAQANDTTNLGEGSYPMLWNFYQMQLYRFIGLSVIEDFNSQSIVGNGMAWSNAGAIPKLDSGTMDLLGPYAGRIGSNNASLSEGAKLFLENTWGNAEDVIDGVIFLNNVLYIDSKHNPDDSSAASQYVQAVNYVPGSGSFKIEIDTTPQIWGLGIGTTTGTKTNGIADYVSFTGVTNRAISLGGVAWGSNSNSFNNGINNYSGSFSPSESTTSSSRTSRLAFVFDQDPVTFTPASYDYKLNYDPTLMATTSAAISVDGMDPITHDFPTYTISVESSNTEYGTVDVSELTDIQWGTTVTVDGNTLTIGETVITATPAEGYRLASWSVANGDMITSDTTITATFELIPVPEPVENKLIKLIPLIVIIALTVMAAIALMSFTGNGIDLIKLLIGLTVCILFVAMAMIPAVGGF